LHKAGFLFDNSLIWYTFYTEERLKKIENELLIIKERNKKVEADKAWETSTTRIILIVLITYVFASIIMYFIGVKSYLLNALVPTLGYFLSTISIPQIKKFWISKRINKI